jgi:putative transposase
MRYRSRRACDAAVRLCIRGLAAQRRRFGYRRLHLLLTREGHHMNHKRFRRLYREEKLQVRRRSGRKRALGVRAPLALPSGPNERWSLDFVSDSFTDGRRFRILAIVDDFTREPGADPGHLVVGGTRGTRVGRPDRAPRPPQDVRFRQARNSSGVLLASAECGRAPL